MTSVDSVTSCFVFVCVFCYSYMVSKMSSKMAGSNNLAHARRMVQQLKVEASIERIKVCFVASLFCEGINPLMMVSITVNIPF